MKISPVSTLPDAGNVVPVLTLVIAICGSIVELIFPSLPIIGIVPDVVPVFLYAAVPKLFCKVVRFVLTVLIFDCSVEDLAFNLPLRVPIEELIDELKLVRDVVVANPVADIVISLDPLDIDMFVLPNIPLSLNVFDVAVVVFPA